MLGMCGSFFTLIHDTDSFAAGGIPSVGLCDSHQSFTGTCRTGVSHVNNSHTHRVADGFPCWAFTCSAPTIAADTLRLRSATSGPYTHSRLPVQFYPTSMRALGLGTCSGMARVGAIATPFVAQVLLKHSAYMAISLYGGMCLVAAVASLLLPYETRGRAMQVSVPFPCW